MLGVEGQYRAVFSVAEQKDFLLEEHLVIFKIIEDVGNVLPTFELVFDVLDEKQLKYFHEGNLVTISLGEDMNKLSESLMIPTSVSPTRTGQHEHRIRMTGIYYRLPYLTDKKVKITNKLNSQDAIKEIVSPYFTFKTNVSASDKMNWIQPNITDKAMVTHIWGHSYIPNSYPMIGITIGGEFRFLDFKKIAKDPYKYRFTNEIESAKDIIHDKGYHLSANSTFMNQVAAYGKQKLISNLEDGTFTLLQQDPTKPTLSLSDKTVRSEIQPRYDEHSDQSADNVHLNFWKAKLQNLVSLFSLTTVKIQLQFIKNFKPIHPLDLVFFKEQELKSDERSASESITGLYIVTKVVRIVEKKIFRTCLEIVRESANSIKGDLK